MSRDPTPTFPAATRVAKRVVRVLEGTLIPDLRSMAKSASVFDDMPDRDPSLGALNFGSPWSS